MKKEAILFLAILLFISSVSAVQYACSDQSQISIKSEEITEGEGDSILGLSLGVCSVTANSYYNWVEGIIFVDSNLITMTDSNITYGTELVSANDSISYASITAPDIASITIGSTSQEIELGECSQIGSKEAMLAGISGSGSTATVKVLVGDSAFTLNTNNNATALIEFNSNNYAVELAGGSSADLTLRVSKCSSGSLVQLVSPTSVNASNATSQNQTSSNSTANETSQNSTVNQTQINQNNQTPQCPNIGIRNGSNYCNPEGFYNTQKENSQTCYKNYECISNYCKNEICEKKGFFRKIIDWFKRLSF